MKLLDFYIGSRFLKCFLLVIIILAAVFSLIEFLSQLDDVGKGMYRLGDALIFVAFSLPRCLIDLMPVSAMLGGTIALGLLADHRELLAMQVAGISETRICLAVFATLILRRVYHTQQHLPEGPVRQVLPDSRKRADIG